MNVCMYMYFFLVNKQTETETGTVQCILLTPFKFGKCQLLYMKNKISWGISANQIWKIFWMNNNTKNLSLTLTFIRASLLVIKSTVFNVQKRPRSTFSELNVCSTSNATSESLPCTDGLTCLKGPELRNPKILFGTSTDDTPVSVGVEFMALIHFQQQIPLYN